ncbi:MAG: 3'-5' exonuclease, partial [bacterium]|nr:3'-5' exonuclease [bacterium]
LDLPQRYPPPKVRYEISKVKNNLLDLDGLDDWLKQVFDEYESELRRQNAFDFDDLIEKVVRLFRLKPDVLKKYQNRFAYILIDEYQDINLAQYALVKLLSGGHRNLNVVGDDEQSIYGFRWSDFTNFLHFERDWPEAKIVELGENYRSTSNIVKGSAAVIGNNKFQRPKDLWTENGAGDPIKVIGTDSAEEEAEAIVGDILKSRLKEFAILYRTNAQSRALEQALSFNGVPYEIFGGLKFYERKEIKDLVAGLRYALNPRDELSRERLEKNFRRAPARELIENLPTLAEELSLLELIGFFLKTTGYYELLSTKFENADDRIENVSELVNFASTFESLGEFLERISLLQPTDSAGRRIKLRPNQRGVKLMTIHLAKGLEFDSVYVVGVNEGLLPHQRSLYSESELEEERRLMYVAMTRARHNLTLGFYGLASRFLYEIPPELIEFSSADSFSGEFTEREIHLD